MTRRIHGLQRGFTLIEIMVVVVIIGLLATVVVTNVFSKVGESRITKAKQDIRVLETTLDLYKLDNFRVPTTEQGLAALVTKPDTTLTKWNGPYVKRASFKDPWGNNYVYESPGSRGGEYDLYTLGADAQPGGEKDDADIGNWNLSD